MIKPRYQDIAPGLIPETSIDGERTRITATCDAQSGRMLVLAGRPLNEPIARRGPFVMSTEDELREA